MSATIQATGFIGKDAQILIHANGKIVYRFPLATHTMILGANGYYRRKTEWHKCELYVSHNDSLHLASLVKGTQVVITGRLRYRKWETHTLRGRRTVKQAYIEVNDLEVFTGKKRV